LRAADDAAAKRPNILFLIADDWGWNHSGAYGCTWIKTPTFDRLAREGVLFKNCFTNNPKCSPCRASILTGRSSWQLEEASCHYGLFTNKFPVYTDLLESAGYDVGFTGKGWGPGEWRAGGFAHNPAGRAYNKHKATPALTKVVDFDVPKDLADFLAERRAGHPFCFWIGTKEPHRDYDRDSGIRAGRNPADVVVPKYLPDHDIVRRDLLDYALAVERGDELFGRALEVLEASGELDNTLVVMTSDHGIPFPRAKGQIYEDGFHLPLAIRWPKQVRPGRVVDDFVDVRDFAPTFLAAAGLKPPTEMSGSSFLDVLGSERSGQVEPSRTFVLVGKERHDLGRPHDWGYPVRAIRTPQFLFLHNYEPDRWPSGNPETGMQNTDGGPTKDLLIETGGPFYDLAFSKRPEFELYRVADDPQCLKNLADDPQYAGDIRALRTQMETRLRADQDPRILGNGAVFDTYKYLGPRRHGYDEFLRSQEEKATLKSPR
jgi:arylsulfatase A-like enzyme